MERKDFLKSVGVGAAFALTFSCLIRCSNEDSIPFIPPNGSELPSNTLLFTVNLDSDEALNLQTNGGFIVKDDIVVAKSLSGNYLAATVICSHESRKQVTFTKNEFYCSAHEARFDQSGNGLNDFGKKGLTTYQTKLEGNFLSILT